MIGAFAVIWGNSCDVQVVQESGVLPSRDSTIIIPFPILTPTPIGTIAVLEVLMWRTLSYELYKSLERA